MKKFVVIFFAVVVLFVAGMLIYIKVSLPNVGDPEEISLDLSQERIERGKYLANSVMVCMDCHSERDWSLYAGPPVESTLGQGGEVFNQEMGLPGSYIARNITPYGIGDWTDGEVLRAIAAGVNKHGQALFPIMPYPAYGTLDKEDLYSIVAYLRTIPSIPKDHPSAKSDFPMSIIINTIPHEPKYSQRPSLTDTVAYGEYMVRAAACTDCHTMMEKGKPIHDMYMAGGFEFGLPTGGIVRSMNITPDKETGIGNWTRDFFIQRFKLYADSAYVPAKIGPGDFNTTMPWTMYAHMTEEDLGAIYEYLQTVPPISHRVERFTSTP